jgi:DNA-directed RNA polymerase beta subunit
VPISSLNLQDDAKLLKSQIEDFNKYQKSLLHMIPSQFRQVKDVRSPSGETLHYEFGFKNIRFARLTVNSGNKNGPMLPNHCRSSKDTYAVNLYCEIEGLYYIIHNNGTRTDPILFTISEAQLGGIPCPVGSQMCAIANMDSLSKRQLGEDPSDTGGYYIIDGSEKALIATKSVIKNAPQFYKHNKDGIVVKCDVTSQHGDGFDSSHYIVVQMMNDEGIIIRIDINRDVVLYLPFQIVYRIFGMTSDRDICNTVLPNYDPNDTRDIQIYTSLRKAFRLNYVDTRKELFNKNKFSSYFNDSGRIEEDPTELILRIADTINSINTGTTFVKYETSRSNLEKKRATVNQLLDKFDQIIFPHIGTTAGSRYNKLNYLGALIHSSYGVRFGDGPSDRNSLANQVVSTTQLSLMMSFKAIFNLTIVTKIVRDIQKAVTSSNVLSNFNVAGYIRQNMGNSDLLKNLCRAIKAGNKPKIKINKQVTTNRIITNLLERNNKTATISTLHSMQTTKNIGGKSNDAIIQSRMPHPSAAGILCPIKSVEGSSAGIVSEFTISMDVSDMIMKDDIEKLIADDPDTTDIGSVVGGNYSRIIINGNPICLHPDTKLLANKLRKLRREGVIHKHASVIYHPLKGGDLEICTQKGRSLRPLIIVYNNFAEHIANPKVKFEQWVKYKPEHADMLTRKEIDLDWLISNQIVEMISPLELKNIFVADCVERFTELRNDVRYEFTHLDLPLSNFGTSVLSCPHINHSPVVRTTYEGNQRRQTLGVPVLNWYSTFYGKLSVALNTFKPVTETIVNNFIRTDGGPIIMQIRAGGNNQEDSLIVNETFTDFGRFSINYYVTHVATLETNQSFNTPTRTTEALKSNNYTNLINGIPKIGTVIRKGDPIIGITERGTDTTISDHSIIHKKGTETVVSDTKAYNINGYSTVSVKVSSMRNVQAGDKFSARSGGKSIISGIEYTENIPVSESGITPDAVLNNHAFPSRMITNQMIEGEESLLAAILGVTVDATVFNEANHSAIVAIANKLGIKRGNHVFYDAISGERIINELFMAPMFYQRLSKMINEQSSAVDNPTIDIRTQQTIRGINNSGGTKFGEMEKDCWLCIGAMAAVDGKMFQDCDGKRAFVCNNCHNMAAVNTDTKLYKCTHCIRTKTPTTFSGVRSSFATFNLFNTLIATGIRASPVPASCTF